MECLRSTEPT
jgi:hypothetical protein